MGSYPKDIAIKLNCSTSKVYGLLHEMHMSGLVLKTHDVGWRISINGRKELDKLAPLIVNTQLTPTFEETIYELMGNKEVTASQLSEAYYGSSRYTGPVRRALFLLMEQGIVERVGAPSADTYKII